MSNLPNVPLTLIAPVTLGDTIVAVVNGKWIALPKPSVSDSCWILVLDRTSLAVEYNAIWTQPDVAPPIPKHLDDPRYMLIVITYTLTTPNVPSGAFYDFLIDNGAGAGLRTIVRANSQVGCGVIATVGYILVGQLGEGRPVSYMGIEEFRVLGGPAGVFLTLDLVPVDVGGVVTYTPSRLSG